MCAAAWPRCLRCEPFWSDRFEATIGDRVVKTKTKRKTEAIADFNTATQQGHAAVIAKQVAFKMLPADRTG